MTKLETSLDIPDFPKLYIFKNNKVYEWSIKIEKDGKNYKMTTSHGQKDGAIVNHETIIEKGKASRTPLEQAILEAQSKWNSKKNKDLYSETISYTKKIDVRPMLAKTFDPTDYKKTGRAFKISFPAYLQRKYDGIRCISYLDKSGETVLESRKGVRFENFDLLKDFLKGLFEKLPSNFYFDGELFTDEIDFEVVSGLIRLQAQHASNDDLKKIDKIKYFIYDFYDADNPNLTYQERLTFLNEFFSNKKNQNKLIVNVPTILANNVGDVKRYHDIFVSEGFEGIMVRDKEGPYEPNKRSKFLQKYKEIIEEEFKIVGYHDGTGDEKELIIWECETKDGKPFSVRPKGTREMRKKLYDEGNKYIGSNLTVIFQEYTADGVPRFPVGKGIRDIY